MIYYLLGKSCSGKDTIYKRLKPLKPEWLEVTRYTTRPIRDGETDGDAYFFIDDQKLESLEKAGKVIEMQTYQTVYGPWKYATIDDGQINRTSGKDYLMIGVLTSYVGTRDYFGRDYVTPLYIEVPDEIRLARAEAREMTQKVPKLAEMHRRFQADQKDFSEENLRAAGITRRYQNLDLDKCIDEIIKNTGKSNI